MMIRTIESHSVVMLVIAHPDDEVMFFSPILERLASKRVDVRILCFSTGNADGLGDIRVDELQKCAKLFGIDSQNLDIVDHPQLQDGMDSTWSPELISSIVLGKVAQHKVDLASAHL